VIIGVSGISGSGKTTLVKQLATTLSATTLFWDDYDAISEGPTDYVEWYHSSKKYDAWKYDALVNTLKALKEGKTVVCPATGKSLIPTEPILFDAPLGRCHQATGQYIDFLVCLDTPLDIALGRRLIRDHPTPLEMVKELEYYLAYSRPLFTLSSEHKASSDLIVDGSLSLEKLVEQVLEALSMTRFS
jgi:uridine kinase